MKETNTSSSCVAVQEPPGCYSCPLADSTILTDRVKVLHNIVVILFCLRCGPADIFEDGTRCLFFYMLCSGGPARAPASLMWSRSDLMTITVGCFGSVALSTDLLPILRLVRKMLPIMILLPLSFSRQITRYCPSGGPRAVQAGWHTDVCPSAFFCHLCLFTSPSLCLILSIFRG